MASDELDLYANIEEDFVEDSHDPNELYDDAVGPIEKDLGSDSERSSRIISMNSLDNNDSYTGVRIANYIGNLTWWTTDEDILDALHSLGINDILQVKCHENRMNGQSKGSHTAVEIARDKLSATKIHGRKPVLANCNKRNLQLFDQWAQESSNGGVDYEKTSFNPSDLTRNNTLGNSMGGGSFRDRDRNRDHGTTRNSFQSTGSVRNSSLNSSTNMNISVPPPGFSLNTTNPGINTAAFMQAAHHQVGLTATSATSMQLGLMPGASGMAGLGAIRPAFSFPGFPPAALAMAGGLKPDQTGVPSIFPQMKLNEVDFEESLQKNKTIVFSAINRAVQDAAAGEFGSAIETLTAAISLVKQSKIASDDKCKILINTIQETLSGIESRSYSSKGGRDRRRRRSYSGSDSEDDYRRGSRHHRRRSRSRDRDRYESKHRRSSPPRDIRSSRDDHHRSGGGSGSSGRVEYYGSSSVGASGSSSSGIISNPSLNNMMPNSIASLSSYQGGGNSRSFRQ